MIRHIALFRCKENVSAEAVEEALSALRALPARIGAVRSFHAGRDLDLIEGTFDFALVAEFDDAASYLQYANHPDHRSVSETYVLPIVSDLVRVQIDAS